MKRVFLLLASVGGAAAGVRAWLRRSRADGAAASVDPVPPVPLSPTPPPASAGEAGTSGREAESRGDDETRYDRAVEAEGDDRREAAQRLREDPLTERLDTPPDDAA